jgi:TonB family protein
MSSNAEVVRQVLPDVPRSAMNTIQGKIRVSVRVDVDSSGKVASATLTSPGPSQYFSRLALQAARRWEFKPPQVNGQPARSAWLLRFRFGRTATEVSPVRADP